MQQRSICFIGGGNMAQAIVFGLLKQQYPAHLICVCDPNAEKLARFSALNVKAIKSSPENNAQAVKEAEVVILAVKPQAIAKVCQSLSAVDFSPKLVISIAAGIACQRLQELLPNAKAIIRAMPNTPALVSCGMTGLFADQNTAEKHRTFAQDLMNAIGQTCWLEQETQMHAITAGSGSSPAYFFLLMEAMQQALQTMKIEEKTARLLVQQAALGAAKMVIENPEMSIATLRENVTSKGGTTAAALAVFEQQGFCNSVQLAMQACVVRSQEMEKSL